MKTLNIRLLVILLVSLIVSGGAVYALHRYQVGRNADVFLHLARRALQEAEAIDDTTENENEANRRRELIQRAERNYRLFVQLRPEDIEVLEELGELQMDLLQYPQALHTLESVVRLDPDHAAARRNLVEITMAFGRFSDAKSHLELLLRDAPHEAELLELLGICQLMSGDNREAVKTLESAIRSNPAQVQAYRYLAVALRFRLNEESRADEWIRSMIEANPESLEARLLAGHYFQTTEAFDEAVIHAAKALELEPDNRDGLWLRAQCELARENRAAARRYAEAGIAKHPEHVPMYVIAADVALREGSRGEAIRRIQQGIRATRRDPQLLWYLGNLQADAGQWDRAAALVTELQETDFSPARVTYLEARLDFHGRRWQDAARKFAGIRNELAPWPNLVKQADYWRGRSYQQLGNRTRAEAAFRVALNLDPAFAPARAALVDLMAADDQWDDAFGEFRRILGAGDAAGSGPAQVVRQALVRALQAPPEARDWTRVERLLNEMERADPQSLDAVRLRAEMLLAQDRAADAEKLLRDATKERPDEIGLWLARTAVAMRQEEWEEAEDVLNEAEAVLDDTVPLRLARARQLIGRYGRQAAGRLRSLAENTGHYDDAEHAQLLLGLTGAAQQIGQWDLVKQWARELAERQPDNLAVRVALFEQAMRDHDREEMQAQLAAIREIDGEGAQWLYGRAVLLSLGAEDGSAPQLDQALKLLERAGEERPRWPRVPLLAAGIYERQGRQEEALDRYRTAIDMGEANPNAYRRLIQLLVERGLVDEAQQRIEQLDLRGVRGSAALERLRGGLLVNLGQLDQALEHARQAAADSDDYADHLWLGRLAAGKGQREMGEGNEVAAQRLLQEAEEAFLRAVGLAWDAPDAHLSLIQLYAATDRRDLALSQIAQVEQHVAAENRPGVLAAAYDLLGEPAKAEPHYVAAFEAQPTDATRARGLAEFYWRTNRPAQAEDLARRILDGDPIEAGEAERRWARRLLAQILTTRGGYQNLVAARALIDENLKLGDNEADRRVIVALDQAHPSRRQRERAIESLEQLVAEQGEKAPGDMLGLAQLYLAADNWAKARPLLRELVAAHPDEPRYLAILTEAMLSRGETAEAEPYLDRLIAAAPNNFGTVSLQAESLFRQNQYEEAVDLLEEFVDRPGAEPADAPARLRMVAGVLEQFTGRLREAERDEWARRFADAAETLYRRYLQLHPEHELVLAAFLARQGRTVEAIGMFERRWPTLNTANLAQMATLLLKSDAATDGHVLRTERIVERALQENPGAVPLHLVMAELRTEQQRYAEAEQHYRDVLRHQPDHAIAMNNLAVLLGLQGIELDEAEQFVGRAIELAGPVAPMLDTRATVYRARGEYDRALSDIERAIAEDPSPVWIFHRALIHYQAGRQKAAAQSLAEAHRRGLTSAMLQPLERPDYQKMRQELKP